MKTINRMIAVLTAFTIMMAMMPITVFAEKTEYTTVILELDEGSDLVDLEGNSLTDVLTSDGNGGYICEVGTTLEFTIELESEYELMYECYGLEGAAEEDCFGGSAMDWNDSKECYQILLDKVGTYTISTFTQLIPTWEENLMSLLGFSAGVNYFTADEQPTDSTIYNFVKMNLYEYINEDWYYELSYAEYMSVVEKYFENYGEMKDYLVKLGEYDEQTDTVLIYSGGAGGGVNWILTSTYEKMDGTYVLQGLFLSDMNTTGIAYDDYWYIEEPVELTITSTQEDGWKILSFERGDYWIHEDASVGTVLTVLDDSGNAVGEPYHCINIVESSLVELELSRAYTFEHNDHHWYSPNRDCSWKALPTEGYSCQVMVEKYLDGEISTSYGEKSGVIYGNGEVTLTTIPYALFTMESNHAEVKIEQGLTDMLDGTYAYGEGSAIELTVQAEDGYQVDSVMVGDYQAKLNSFGTYTAYPSFKPGKIVVETSAVIESSKESVENVTVSVKEEELKKFDGLTLVVDEIEETVKEEANLLIAEAIDAEETYILDIYFEDIEGQEVSVNATMNVTIPIPEGWDPDRVAVYYVNPETGEVTDMNGTVSADGKTITFVTTHFSNYALVQSVEELVNPFVDVAQGVYYHDPVLWAVKNKITSGTSDTTFGPENACTRGQVVTFLWRTMGSPEPKTTAHNFTDIQSDAYYYKAILWAVEKGITSGLTETTFGPEDTVTRGQFVTFLHRAEGKPSYEASNPFVDVSFSEFYYDAILWAVENKITSGTTNTTFGPEDACTRGQVVTFLHRAYK